MQIRELSIPENSQNVTYVISWEGVRRVVDQRQREGERETNEKWDGCKIRLGALNSIQLTKSNDFKDLLSNNPLIEIPVETGGEQGQRTAKFKCNCKRSKCLKLYCECFAKKLFCGLECECHNCSNQEINALRLGVLRQEMPPRKFISDKGCRCQKSGCQKRYCQCFQKGIKCTKQCHCNNCLNCQVTEPTLNYDDL